MPTAEPVPLTADCLSPAIAMMGRAFKDDPFLVHLAPDPVKREKLAPQFVAIVVKFCFKFGEVWTYPAQEGVAAWLVPDNTNPSLGQMLQTGMLTMPLKFGWAGFQRFSDVVGFTEKLHKEHAPGRHWYLWGLGVDPAHQGSGLGGKLMQPVLAKADAAGLPVYLETQNESNLPFYERHGFKVAGSGESPKSKLAVWALVRPPQDK
jgi:ribosomal protein S18 acetylase RimI-like enzyme